MTFARAEIVGHIWQFHAHVGDLLNAGDTIAIMESMKMEIPIVTPVAGRLKQILVDIDQIVQEGDHIAEIEAV